MEFNNFIIITTIGADRKNGKQTHYIKRWRML